MIKNKRLFIFTLQFPHGNGEAFLESELSYLQPNFDEIVLVPRDKTKAAIRALPEGVTVDHSFANAIPGGWAMILSIGFALLTNHGLYKEIWVKPHLLMKWKSIKLLLYYSVVKNVTRKWYDSQENEGGVFYTYWLESFTYGLCQLKSKETIKVISRAHRYDLFEATHSRPYLPFRAEIFDVIDQVHVISRSGFDYLQSKEGLVEPKLNLSRLGTKDPEFRAKASSDGVLRIVSCSNVVELKRIDLIIETISQLAQEEHFNIAWTHIGDGPLLKKMKAKAEHELPKSVDYKFLGSIPNHEVLNFYRQNPVDTLINLSTIEGIPVSFMEAMSCGIPVIGTDVGGVSEILDATNGIMLSARPTISEIVEALSIIHSRSERANGLRAGARKTWETKFSAQLNYEKFAASLD